MLYPIEIKANIEGGVGEALAALGNPTPDTKRLIWFVEGREAAQTGTLPLLERGIVLRIRSGEGPDDSTTKLRPTEEQALSGQWSKSFTQLPLQYRIEGDWAGDRHALAASAVIEHSQGSLAGLAGAGRLAQVFTPPQHQLVEECTDAGFHTDQLVALGPIGATKWKSLHINDIEGVDAERWSVAGLDFLELSIRVERGDDEAVSDYEERSEQTQRSLIAAIDKVGLQLSANPESKTKRVLEAMAADV